MAFLDDIIKRAKEERKTIVLPEATDLRTLSSRFNFKRRFL